MRRTLILIHLLVAGFIAPAFLLLAVSGGLYLFGVKGELVSTPIVLADSQQLDFESTTLENDVRTLFREENIELDFEYLKGRGNLIQTRPTSRTYIEIVKTEMGIAVTRQDPSLQKRMIELHKGHGPQAFKTYQKLVAIALLGSVLSGVWMGIASPALRRKTLLAISLGLLVFLFLALK